MSRTLSAVVAGATLASPTVGTWVPLVTRGAVLSRGMVLGRLRQARRWHDVVAPAGVAGQALEVAPAWSRVEHGRLLIEVGQLDGGVAAEQVEDTAVSGRAIRAAMAGTVYLRPSPADPPFAPAGSTVTANQTVALVEVMKTFTPLAAGVDGTLESWLVEDGEAVDEGQALAVLAG